MLTGVLSPLSFDDFLKTPRTAGDTSDACEWVLFALHFGASCLILNTLISSRPDFWVLSAYTFGLAARETHHLSWVSIAL